MVERKYTIQGGDTLSAIALRELGDANRWPEIFERNKVTIEQEQRRRGDAIRPFRREPVSMLPRQDWIFPGTVLVLPA